MSLLNNYDILIISSFCMTIFVSSIFFETPCIWHEALFRKLENKGINGNFLKLIQNIYSKTRCAVKINDKTTTFFSYEKGEKLRFVRRVLCQMETRYKLQQNQMHDVLQRHSKRITQFHNKPPNYVKCYSV